MSTPSRTPLKSLSERSTWSPSTSAIAFWPGVMLFAPPGVPSIVRPVTPLEKFVIRPSSAAAARGDDELVARVALGPDVDHRGAHVRARHGVDLRRDLVQARARLIEGQDVVVPAYVERHGLAVGRPQVHVGIRDRVERPAVRDGGLQHLERVAAGDRAARGGHVGDALLADADGVGEEARGGREHLGLVLQGLDQVAEVAEQVEFLLLARLVGLDLLDRDPLQRHELVDDRLRVPGRSRARRMRSRCRTCASPSVPTSSGYRVYRA